MSAFQDKFTTSLAMWSPPVASSFYFGASPVVHQNALGYYHEPVYYPATCIICGLPHYPIPHHKTKTVERTLIIPTPTPYRPERQIMAEQKAFAVNERRTHRKRTLNYVQTLFYRALLVIRKPFIVSRRRNIYPFKKPVRLIK